MQEYKQALAFGKTNKDETIINMLINRRVMWQSLFQANALQHVLIVLAKL